MSASQKVMNHHVAGRNSAKSSHIHVQKVDAQEHKRDCPGWNIDWQWEKHEGLLRIPEDERKYNASIDGIVALIRNGHSLHRIVVHEKEERANCQREKNTASQKQRSIHLNYAHRQEAHD